MKSLLYSIYSENVFRFWFCSRQNRMTSSSPTVTRVGGFFFVGDDAYRSQARTTALCISTTVRRRSILPSVRRPRQEKDQTATVYTVILLPCDTTQKAGAATQSLLWALRKNGSCIFSRHDCCARGYYEGLRPPHTSTRKYFGPYMRYTMESMRYPSKKSDRSSMPDRV